MNSNSDLAFRLLKLIPVAELKKFVTDSKNKNQDVLIEEVIKNLSFDNIKEKVISKHSFTKQHIFCFKKLKNISSKSFHQLLPNYLKSEGDNHYYFFEHKYELICIKTSGTGITGRTEILKLNFLQPIRINVSNNSLIVHLTTLERSAGSYLDGYEILKQTRLLDDEDVIDQLLMNCPVNLEVLDLNKGIKYLWDNDEIDSPYATFKKESSTSREVMDEDLTLKETYPELYKEMIKSPLRKIVFRINIDLVKLCDFTSNATEGTLAISKYPSNENQVNNVVSEILTNN